MLNSLLHKVYYLITKKGDKNKDELESYYMLQAIVKDKPINKEWKNMNTDDYQYVFGIQRILFRYINS